MDFETLKNLFISNTNEAIEESKKIICSSTEIDSYKNFISHFEKDAQFSICPSKYSDEQQLCVYCLDCTLNKEEPTTMCVSCFLYGNHEGHNFFILKKKSGICSCGDRDFLKDTCICSKHNGFNEEESHPEMNLNENLRTVLTDKIFKAAFLSFKSYVDNFNRSISIIFDFLMDFTKLGDGFIRLIVQTLLEKIDFDEFVGLLLNNFDTFNDCIYKLFYSIISDQIFKKHLTKSLCHFIFDNLGPDSPHNNYFFSNVRLYKNELIYKGLIDICFSEQSCIYNIEKNHWDWVESCIELLKSSKKLFVYDLDINFKSSPPILEILSKVQYMTKLQPNEATQSLFDKMITDVFNIDNNNNKTVIISTFNKLILLSNHSAFLSFLEVLQTFLNCFKSKPNLQMDKLIQELDKIDIAPIYLIGKNEFAEENDVLVSKYLLQTNEENNSFFKKFKSMITKVFKLYPSKYYKSFCHGSSIFLSYPLYDIFGLLLRVDDLCRIKLSKLLCLENYRPLRLKLGIIAMKKLLSSYCHNCGLINYKNKALISFYDSIIRQNETIKLNLIPVSILQMMIGLQSCDKNEEFAIKEFFAYEIAREVGLFDKDFSNQIKYKFLIFLYVVLLIVIDRTIFYDDNCEKSIEERIILGLKNNVKSIKYISLLIGNVFPNKPHMFYKMFNEILMKVATTNKNETNINNDKKENEEDESNLMKSLLQSQVLPDNNNNDNDEDDENENENNQNENENNQNENENDHVDNENENNEKEKQIRYGKNVMFYLKNGIEWKRISASTSIYYQMKLLNSEISKNPEKLLQLQTFEPEETFFFKSNEESQIDSEGLHICLKELLFTPTVFAVIYTVLTDVDKLNLHLAMNILILISKTIKESETTSSVSPITINKKIVCNSIIDLVSQLKKIVFNFRIEGENDSKQGFIENTINSVNFISLMNLKISYNKKEPKSFIDLLKMNGKIGEETLERISQNIPIDGFSNDNKNKEEQNEENEELIKQMKKEKANRKKAEIMNHFQNQLNHYHFSDSLSESLSINKSDEIPFNKDVCCICSESGSEKILCYPLYMYRTKFPFIIDKPPLFDKEEDTIAIDDNQIDFGNRKDFIDLISPFASPKGLKEDQLSEREKFIMKILQKEEYNEDSPKKRYTAGENYVFQFGIDTHPIHINCILDSIDENGVYKCSIDNSYRNIFLPYLEDVPINEVFSNIETFKLNNSVNGNHIRQSILSFVKQYIEYLEIVQNTDIILELIKSISGLIVTYEVRLRNRPDALDHQKNKILSRNLFLLTWYYFRFFKKPAIFIEGKTGENIFNESRLTDFQRLIKMLIECDDILDKEEKIQQIIPSIISSIIDENVEIKEKKICLFLRRLCLAEYFLLNNDVNLDDTDLIDWDEILTAKNLSKRYKVKFTSIDIENDDFEFKPFSLMNFPKDFLGFSQKPFNYPIQFQSGYSFINLLDYNYMINHYDDLEENNNSNQNDEDLHFKNIFVDIKEEEIFGYYCFAYCCRVCPSILMFMQNNSPMIVIIDHSFIGYLMPMYFDKYGCIQLQYERNLPVFFNENSYEILLDKILSGDFSYDLLSFEEVIKGFRH